MNRRIRTLPSRRKAGDEDDVEDGVTTTKRPRQSTDMDFFQDNFRWMIRKRDKGTSEGREGDENGMTNHRRTPTGICHEGRGGVFRKGGALLGDPPFTLKKLEMNEARFLSSYLPPPREANPKPIKIIHERDEVVRARFILLLYKIFTYIRMMLHT